MNPVERIGPESFDGPRLRRPGRWAVAFVADWCSFCVHFLPEFERWDGERHRLLVADVSEDEDPLWDRFAIDVVPSVLVFDDGGLIARADGTHGVGLEPAALARVRQALGSDSDPSPHAGPGRGPEPRGS